GRPEVPPLGRGRGRTAGATWRQTARAAHRIPRRCVSAGVCLFSAFSPIVPLPAPPPAVTPPLFAAVLSPPSAPRSRRLRQTEGNSHLLATPGARCCRPLRRRERPPILPLAVRRRDS